MFLGGQDEDSVHESKLPGESESGMTLWINIRAKAACARHPRYNPARDGEAGIKGGCVHCKELFDLHTEASRLERLLHLFASREELAEQTRRHVKEILEKEKKT